MHKSLRTAMWIIPCMQFSSEASGVINMVFTHEDHIVRGVCTLPLTQSDSGRLWI